MSKELEQLRERIKDLRKRDTQSVSVPTTVQAYDGMSVEEYREISLLYGTNIKGMKECRPNMENRLNYVQSTVKIMFALDQEKLKQQYAELVESNACLRTAYYCSKKQKCYQIQLKTQSEAIRFFDLSEKSEEEAMDIVREGIFSDRRRNFRLERDPLIRVLVFRVKASLHYALISQVCEDDGSEKAALVIHKLFGQYLVYKEGRDAQDAYKVWTPTQERYWKNYLRDLGRRQYVPGYIENDEIYRKGVWRCITDQDFYENLCRLSERTKTHINDIMEAAWAILLHRFYDEEDILFGAAGGHEYSGILPIRTIIDDKIKAVRVIIGISERNRGMIEQGTLSLGQLEKGLALSESLINHMLSFSNMALVETTKASKKEAKEKRIIVANYMEERWDFCLHIRVIAGRIALNCIYNQNSYEAVSVQAVLDTYLDLLRQISADEQQLIGSYQMSGFHRIEDHTEEKEKQYLQRVLALSEHPAFGTLPAEELEQLALAAQLQPCAAYDVILAEGEEIENVAFIMEGSVRISRAGKDGWERPILLLKKDQMLTGKWILNDKSADFTTLSNSPDTTLMLIPIPVMESLMGRYPAVARAIFEMENERYLKVVRLWMNAD